jgi:membrane protein required for colicin V production
MHWLDITILVVLGVGAAMGFCSGLLWQVARVVSLAASLYLAILTNTNVSDWLGEQWKDASPAFNRVVGFLAVFLLVYLILYIITRLIHKAIKASRLETIDRLLGAVLGAVKMAAVMACVCAVMAALDLQIFKEWFEQATIAPHFAKGTEAVVSWVPQSYRDRIDEGVMEIRQQLHQRITDAAIDTLKGDAAKK